VIAALCESLETLDEPEAKASMIWIIGEYADRIENADELLDSFFLDSFSDETPQVRLISSFEDHNRLSRSFSRPRV